jgi:ABC-type glycerol-3-phosphate transport system substrate-binding protein
MLQAAAKLNSDGVRGWAAPMSIQYLTIQNFMAVYLSHGGRLIDAGKCEANTPEFQAAIDKYVAAFKSQVTAPDATTLEGDRFRRGFIEGRFAMIIDQPGVWHDLQLANPPYAKEVALAQVPAGPKGLLGFLGGFPLVLWKASRVKDAAAKWILYATSPEGGLRELSVKSGMIPARNSLAQQAPWSQYPYTVFTTQMAKAYPYTYPLEGMPQMAQLEVKPVQAAIQAVAMGQKTARDYARMPAEHAEAWPDAQWNLLEDVYRAVRGVEPPPGGFRFATFTDGVRSMRVVDAALVSAAQGGWADVKTGE